MMRSVFEKISQQKISLLLALLVIQGFTFAVLAQTSANIKLNVDASDASRNVLHVTETLPVAAGQITLFYPKWIPGEHTPTGTINDVVNLFISANGKPILWQRDDVEMFAFHCEIPAGAKQLEIAFDDVSQPGTTMSAQLARIKWNRLVLYPQGAPSDKIQVSATLKLPLGWKYATALPVLNETPTSINFKDVSLTYLVDSPAIIGKNFKKVPLATDKVLHEMDIAADTGEALEIKPETLAGFKNLVAQANALFGARHYDSYRFLLTFSDIGGSEGLEHHESSEDGVGEKALSDTNQLIDLGELLGHEYTHSWNGKYRRPARLLTPDFEQPMHGDLLWVYEGLTEYLGKLLPARSGLWTPETFRESIAEVAAETENQAGRKWRPLVDTARGVQLTYSGARAWRNARRGADYYYEGALLWMEADVLIRQKSNGRLSLDDFCRKFHGGQNTAPLVKPYDLAEVAATLNEVLPSDWRSFLNERVYAIAAHAPLGGITNGGWKVVYNDAPNLQNQVDEQLRSFVNLSFSIGLLVKADGTILDVNPNLAGGKAGLAPGLKITSVNGRSFSGDVLHAALAATKNNAATLELTVENGGFTESYKINYQGGERYPHLERDAAKPDLLSEVTKPLK